MHLAKGRISLPRGQRLSVFQIVISYTVLYGRSAGFDSR